MFLETDQYFAALLLNNPYYSIRLQRLFGSSLFSSVAVAFLAPRPRPPLMPLLRLHEHLYLAVRLLLCRRRRCLIMSARASMV